jgi:hypothetical protein
VILPVTFGKSAKASISERPGTPPLVVTGWRASHRQPNRQRAVYNLVYVNRTNIYLEEEQARSLDEVARSQGISRAALIRQLINRGLDQRDGDLESDLAAIVASFNVLAGDEDFLERGADERSTHLEKVRAKR